MVEFSIIIPTYNRAWCIERAIKSILAQDFQGWEMIIVDDGSTDNTREIVEKYLSDTRIKYFFKENGGVGSARNLGIKNAKGEMMVFLDSDDELVKEALFVIKNSVDNFPSFSFFIFGTKDEDGKSMYFMEKKVNEIHFEDYIENKKVFGEMCSCLKRKVFFDNNKLRFPEKVNGGEGLLWYNLIKKYPALCTDKIIRIYHKDASNSLVRQNLDKKKALNIYNVNRLIVENFQSDLIKYNKRSLSINYFVMANMLALLGEKKKSKELFARGYNISKPSAKRMVLYLVCLIDINFILYNLLNRLRI